MWTKTGSSRASRQTLTSASRSCKALSAVMALKAASLELGRRAISATTTSPIRVLKASKKKIKSNQSKSNLFHVRIGRDQWASPRALSKKVRTKCCSCQNQSAKISTKPILLNSTQDALKQNIPTCGITKTCLPKFPNPSRSSKRAIQLSLTIIIVLSKSICSR